MNHAFVTAWMSCIAIFSFFGFMAAAYFHFIIGSLLVLGLAAGSMNRKMSRILLVVASLGSAAAGATVNIFFWSDGGISQFGAIYIGVPAFVVLGCVVIKIFFLEYSE